MEGDQEERTFLFGYQHTRGYGSLSNPQTSTKAYRTIVQHHIGPYDTLQGLVLKYNTSMSEIKRLNRLWSNESLHLKEYVDIPIYDEVSEQFPNSARSLTITGNSLDKTSSKSKEMDSESVNDIFKRIDMNIRKTTDNVYKLAKSSVTYNSESPNFELSRSRPEGKDNQLRDHHPLAYQNEAYQN